MEHRNPVLDWIKGFFLVCIVFGVFSLLPGNIPIIGWGGGASSI